MGVAGWVALERRGEGLVGPLWPGPLGPLVGVPGEYG